MFQKKTLRFLHMEILTYSLQDRILHQNVLRKGYYIFSQCKIYVNGLNILLNNQKWLKFSVTVT